MPRLVKLKVFRRAMGCKTADGYHFHKRRDAIVHRGPRLLQNQIISSLEKIAVLDPTVPESPSARRFASPVNRTVFSHVLHGDGGLAMAAVGFSAPP
jgi:hypothetical protein